MLYNDSTRMILHENGEQVQYLNKEMKEEMCLIDKYPSELKKKVSLITYFRKYMNDHLLKVSIGLIHQCKCLLHPMASRLKYSK